MHNFIMISFTDKVKAVFDIWIIGDCFVKELFSIIENLKQEKVPPYIFDYFNVSRHYQQIMSGIRQSIMCIINSLIDAIHNEKKLLKYIVVIPDFNIIEDVNVFEFGTNKVVADITDWLVQQLHMTIHHKRSELVDKKPGSVISGEPKVIFVHMLWHQEPFKPGSKLEKTFAL